MGLTIRYARDVSILKLKKVGVSLMQAFLKRTRGVNWALCFTMWLIIFLATSLPAAAANHYVRAGATGSGTGADWTNACTDFTGSCAVASLVRGDTYYVAAGSYGSRNWNRAASGTLVITIKRATVGDHGADTGWLAAYDGQVHWAYDQTFSTDYWVFDGVTSPATAMSSAAADPTQYGFTEPHSSSCSANFNYPVTIHANQITVAHMSITNQCGASFDFTQYSFTLNQSNPCDNATISHVYSEFTSTDVQVYAGSCNNLTIEYLHSKGQWSTSANHGEIVALGGDNTTFRYNYMEQCTGTGCFASGGPPITNAKIYGNVFNNVSNNAPGVTGCGSSGNGAIVGAGAQGIFSGFQIYNNTIIQPGMCFGWFYTNGGSGNNILKNNIVWGRCDTNMGGTGNITDSNTYLSCWSSPGTETNMESGSYDPFVSSRFIAPGIGDYHLKASSAASCSSTTALCAGATLSSPYNVDPDGNVRGANGTWDRGAYQFLTSVSNGPSPPQSLRVSAIN